MSKSLRGSMVLVGLVVVALGASQVAFAGGRATQSQDPAASSSETSKAAKSQTKSKKTKKKKREKSEKSLKVFFCLTEKVLIKSTYNVHITCMVEISST